MGKALHDFFYIKTDVAIKCYSKSDALFLTDSANFSIERERSNSLKKDPTAQHVLELFGNTCVQIDAFIYDCVDEYFHNGVSDKLLNILNPKLQGVRNQLLGESVNGKLVPVYVAHLPIDSPPTVFAAHMFANIISLGGLDGLKRCQSSDCQKFYVGRSNVRWCSKSCGSRTRVKRMRRKNKF